ncbi:TIGR02117 family protein [Kovacikia minuta CCNUW1]|uniref:TIGR02117 family protein n=1 Tax=Kovacikia minuta TaxID=2931930 RepID=UPI001CCF2890|nr:TIGR02117 family protein [Kovacikia minuta]UBF29145.1 TIGR02117 family protein [Kovacikia minuta CCNUW1]
MKFTAVLTRVGIYLSCGILAAFLLLAIASLTPRKWGTLPPSGNCAYRIYVSGGAMHTNLITPLRNPIFDWNQHLKLDMFGGKAAENYHYLQFGWGDRIFYMETPAWDQINPFSAMRALFLQNSSAMFVKGHATIPRFPNEELKCVSLGQTDYLALMEFIQISFQLDQQGRKIRLGSGQDKESGFYAANGNYSILNTCNSWTANGLRAANVNTPLWGGLAPAVMHHIRNGCECRESVAGGRD